MATSLQTAADEKKQSRSLCIREEDTAESVAIRKESVRLNFYSTRQSLTELSMFRGEEEAGVQK